MLWAISGNTVKSLFPGYERPGGGGSASSKSSALQPGVFTKQGFVKRGYFFEYDPTFHFVMLCVRKISISLYKEIFRNIQDI